MPRYTGKEIQEAWDISPRAAKKQATKALPLIEEEVSKLIGERQICEEILKRSMAEPEPTTADEDKTQEYARGDDEEEGGVGSQAAEPEKEEATA